MFNIILRFFAEREPYKKLNKNLTYQKFSNSPLRACAQACKSQLFYFTLFLLLFFPQRKQQDLFLDKS
jgi:hypothetical protein